MTFIENASFNTTWTVERLRDLLARLPGDSRASVRLGVFGGKMHPDEDLGVPERTLHANLNFQLDTDALGLPEETARSLENELLRRIVERSSDPNDDPHLLEASDDR